jgi:hypothetical protein
MVRIPHRRAALAWLLLALLPLLLLLPVVGLPRRGCGGELGRGAGAGRLAPPSLRCASLLDGASQWHGERPEQRGEAEYDRLFGPLGPCGEFRCLG